MKEFNLRECCILACYGLKSIIKAGKLKGFSKEEEDEIQERQDGEGEIRKYAFDTRADV